MLGNVDFANLFVNLSDKDYPSVAAAKAAGPRRSITAFFLTPYSIF
jgi:hypothetical protein